MVLFRKTERTVSVRKESSRSVSLIVVVFVFLGSLLKVDLVWNLSDLFNGLMVIPNLMALIVLAGTVAKAAKGEKVEF